MTEVVSIHYLLDGPSLSANANEHEVANEKCIICNSGDADGTYFRSVSRAPGTSMMTDDIFIYLLILCKRAPPRLPAYRMIICCIYVGSSHIQKADR